MNIRASRRRLGEHTMRGSLGAADAPLRQRAWRPREVVVNDHRVAVRVLQVDALRYAVGADQDVDAIAYLRRVGHALCVRRKALQLPLHVTRILGT